MAVAAAAARVVAASGPAEVPHTISPGKHNVDTTVVRTAVGCVVGGSQRGPVLVAQQGSQRREDHSGFGGGRFGSAERSG